VTRRAVGGMPTRRGPGAATGPGAVGAAGAAGAGAGNPLSRLPSTAPAIAVTGLGGLRVIQSNGLQAGAGARGGARGGGGAAGNQRSNYR
jgi:hypothetical protein